MKAGQSQSLCLQPQGFSDGCGISMLIQLYLTKHACVRSDSYWKVNSFPILFLPRVDLHMRIRTGLWEKVSPCLKNSGWERWGFPPHPECLGMQNCSTSPLYFSPGLYKPNTWQGTLCVWTAPHPGSSLCWILLQESPFLVTLTSQEQTSWLTRAVFIVGVNNNHLRYNLASEKHLQVLSTPFIVCE